MGYAIALLSLFCLVSLAKDCSGSRGNCNCDCTWVGPNKENCLKDDGSCCYQCCCGSAPPTPPRGDSYCPAAGDLIEAYGKGTVELYDGGWKITSGGAAATKASFNLLGGSVEYDIDFSSCHPGVNGNIYSISPHFSGSFSQPAYCDGAKTGADWCVEVDWIESNGHCGGQTTLHTREGPGSNGCTAWGCANSYRYNGRSSFHMTIKYTTSGQWTTIHDGTVIGPGNLSPAPQDYDWQQLASFYSSKGAVIYSSQWVGWVPIDACGSNGQLDGSVFAIKNLRINGTVVQGPTPRKC